MSHATTRATVLPEIIKLIANHHSITEEEALDRFYSSSTGASYSDDSTGLYGQSALYVFGLYLNEYGNSISKLR